MREHVEIALRAVRKGAEINIANTETLLLDVYRLLDSYENSEDYNICLAAICHIADLNISDKMVQQLLHDCIVKSRIFLYDDLLAKKDESFHPTISFQDRLAKSLYTSSNTQTTLTRPQKEIFDLFQECRRLIVSAPTSFGKTRIISEIIAHNDYKNIVLVMPTVSLLSEQYQSIRQNVRGYKVSKSSKLAVNPDDKHLLILTPERVNIFLEENPDFSIDFFVMDEVYKADYKLDDDRFSVFSDVLYRVVKSNADIYLIGPYMADFSKNFRKKFGIQMRIYDTEIVQKDYYLLDNIKSKGTHIVEGSEIKIIGDRKKNLLRLLTNEAIDGKYLIYRYQKYLVESISRSLLDTWPVRSHNTELIRYLSETVSPDWILIDCIKRGYAFHHGAMPRHIQDLIVDEFNDDSPSGVDYLFCTTSLTEGVNTSAKNVVLYDTKIGRGDRLKTLDRKNIEGRAGRFMRHFVGRVFRLEDIADDNKDVQVELEVFDSQNPSDESLLQVGDSDLSGENVDKKDLIKKELDALNIPLELISKNKFVSVHGQMKIIELLRDQQSLFTGCYFSGSLPNNATSRQILSLIYDSLFTDSNKGRSYANEMGKKILLDKTIYYIYYTPTFAQMLTNLSWLDKDTSQKIRQIFDLTSKYFEFIWPRYLRAFESLYNFVATENGEPHISLEVIAATLEYGTTNTHEILLRDAGVPSEIIKKTSHFFTDCDTLENIQVVYTENRQSIAAILNVIEIKILERYI